MMLKPRMGFVTAKEYLKKRQNMVKLTTCCNDLDDLLDGGFESGTITEIFGESGSGKTQLCHMLSVTCQFPIEKGGGEGAAIYIDTQGTFRPKKIEKIAQRFGLATKDVLDNVYFQRAYSSDHQLKILEEVGQLMQERDFAIIIVDSITALYRSEYTGRAELAVRQQTLNTFCKKLSQLCQIYHVAAVVTNQVRADFSSIWFGSIQKPIGGNIIGHASCTRIS
eukprot:UN13423